MARQSKLSKSQLKRFAKKGKTPRAVDTRPGPKYFLIVSEGTRTEPLYFEGFKKILPKNMVVVETQGAGRETVRIVEEAIKLREKRKEGINPDFDYVWAVFDKDSFPEQDFNEAIKKAKRNSIDAAYTNEAFELWFLLHFEYHNTGIDRSHYEDMLTKCLGFKYKKNDPRMFEHLEKQGNQNNAIKYAKKLLNNFKGVTPAKANPSTTVHELVEKLNEFRKE